jgi:hypothetical protein
MHCCRHRPQQGLGYIREEDQQRPVGSARRVGRERGGPSAVADATMSASISTHRGERGGQPIASMGRGWAASMGKEEEWRRVKWQLGLWK